MKDRYLRKTPRRVGPFTVLANHFQVVIKLQWKFSLPITYEILGGKSNVI